FDHWDHTIQTGNDTEYTLVILALCAGVAYSLARFIVKPAPLGIVAKGVFASFAKKSFFSAPCGFTLLLFDATSPPPLPLRIKKRSEEHTSELQSRGHLVCRLLLEKKKKETIRQLLD